MTKKDSYELERLIRDQNKLYEKKISAEIFVSEQKIAKELENYLFASTFDDELQKKCD